jgi:hypothetical protein
MAAPAVSAQRARSVTPTPGLSRELRGLGATQYKGTRTIKCNMLKKLKEGTPALLLLRLVRPGGAAGARAGGRCWADGHQTHIKAREVIEGLKKAEESAAAEAAVAEAAAAEEAQEVIDLTCDVAQEVIDLCESD